MSTEVLDVSVEAGVAKVVFARPPVNALDVETMRQFTRVFGQLAERKDVRVTILTGDGKTFCAGVDRALFGDRETEVGDRATFLSVHRAFFVSVREFPKPLIAAVNAPAIGAGFALAGACDIMLAAETAFFSMPEVLVGTAAGAAFVTGLLGQSKGRRLFFTGDRISAEEMKALGAIEACVPREDLMAEAMKIASRIAQIDPKVMRAAKQTCLMAAETPYLVAKSLEYAVVDQLR